MTPITRFSIGCLAIPLLAAAHAQQAVRIDSSARVDARVAIAVPPFAADPSAAEYSKQLADVLAADLDFSGLFKIVPSTDYPRNFTGFTPDLERVDFEAWRGTPAEHLAYAYVYRQGNAIVAQCRLFDVLVGQQIVGVQYTVEDTRGWRRLAHKFADEIVRFITGVPGVADSEICFSAGAQGSKEIYIADYDGANLRQATQHGSISIKPKVLPDGRRIAYLSYKDRFPFLYILDLNTGVSQPLSKRSGLNHAPAWAPGGQRLALCLSKDGNTEIYVKNADGTGEQRLTDERGSDTSPCFSPDGSQIAFVSDRGGSPQIYVMAANGGEPRRVSFQGGKAYDPVWSPDGRMIAYTVEKSGEGFQIYVMGADGSNPQQLTQGAGGCESPSWSPDSRHIVFSSSRSGTWQLYTVTVETGVVRAVPGLSHLRTEGPSWGPRRAN